MTYVLLLYNLNKYKKEMIEKAIGPFDTEKEAMSAFKIEYYTTYSAVAVITVTPPEDI